jgi:iron complex transport system substrate-binding protein
MSPIRPDADGAAFGYPQLSDEYLVDADPDIIFWPTPSAAARVPRPLPSAPAGTSSRPSRTAPSSNSTTTSCRAGGPRLVDFIEAIALAVESATVPA